MKLMRMAVLVAVGAAVVALAGIGRPESAGGASDPAGGITVTGTGTVKTTPDQAQFSLGVQSQGSSAREALSANSAKMKRILAALEAAGVAKKDIQTQDVSVSPTYTDKNSVDGYTAHTSVSVTIRKLGDAGSVLDAASNAGATDVYGPTLTRSNQDELRAKALKAAVDDARAKAQALADAAGVRLGSVTAINESGNAMPMPYAADVAASSKLAAPIEPGTQDLQASVRVTFSIA
jgi:uncharacterized protein YggE